MLNPVFCPPVLIACLFTYFDYSEPSEDEKERKPYALIIGVSLGGIFLFALVATCGNRYCKRDPRINSLHSLDSKPAKDVFSNADRYDMTGPKSKEDIISYEEIGISNPTAHYDEIGNTKNRGYEIMTLSTFSKDTARYQNAGILGDAGYYEEIGTSNDAGYYQEIGNSKNGVYDNEIEILKNAEQK